MPSKDILADASEKESLLAMLKNFTNLEKNAEYISEFVKKDIELMEEGNFTNLDKYIQYFKGSGNIFEYIHESNLVFIDESTNFKSLLNSITEEKEELMKVYFEGIRDIDKEVYYSVCDIENMIERHTIFNLDSFPKECKNETNTFDIDTESINSYVGRLGDFFEQVKNWKDDGYKIIIVFRSKVSRERMSEALEQHKINIIMGFEMLETLEEVKGAVIVTDGRIRESFGYKNCKFIVISEKTILKNFKTGEKIKYKDKESAIESFVDINPGDYVVHRFHGIGTYTGINVLDVDGIRKDFLKIVYKDNGVLYVPVNQLDLVQKYIGFDGRKPKINKLGGIEWAKAKNKVKKDLQNLAEKLIKLYALRESKKGFAFSKDNVWQKEFEEYFPYEETEDQLICIEQIKNDMESERPMDRLICGDVGYGKTEVAVRAAFKSVNDGKQVAFLVPTTILAEQHYNNFKERFKEFPIEIDMISRFKNQKEQDEIVRKTKNGGIDILIGTHKLFQKDIKFKELGLLIIDEEQRFGVFHKETIKNISPNIDVLTLSATPIPRTLHMSLVGIRDISIIKTPPNDRFPVKTYVVEHDIRLIKDSISKELKRNGQVYYLYNRVRGISMKASELQRLVPEASVAYVHGQMNEKELESVMRKFVKNEYNVLVCTTIIESGIDVSNVNTLIIEDADKLGLSQLYQIKGRVGRFNRQAYAYLTHKKNKVLSEIAEKRLKAVKEFTEFGAGFKIAMRDMEIRGAGNILGVQQHGQMESIGYDMYCKLLSYEIKRQKGETVEEEFEVLIDLNLDAYIDNTYIEDEQQKIEFYKKIALIQTDEDVCDIVDQLVDRFGEIKDNVNNLIQIAYVKRLAQELKINSITEKSGKIILQFASIENIKMDSIGRLINNSSKKIMFNAGSKPHLVIDMKSDKGRKVIENIKNLLKNLIELNKEF